MKTIYIILLPALLIAGGCNSNKSSMNNDNQKQPVYSSASDAVTSAKSDLVEILRGDTPVNLGLEAGAVESAQAGKNIDFYVLDFNRMMNTADSVALTELVKEKRSVIVPLIASNVVTVVEIGETQEGWKVLGLTDRKITSDINSILNREGKSAANAISIYEIPNLQGNIYQVNTANGPVYYTDYSTRFGFGKGLAVNELLPVLREDALRFFEEYGDSLNEGNLLR